MKEVDKNIVLDDEAQKLFAELGGVDLDRDAPAVRRSGGLSAVLGREETRMDEWRIALVEFSRLLAGYISSVRISGAEAVFNQEVKDLIDMAKTLSGMPGGAREFLIRYRGMVGGIGKTGEFNDYTVQAGGVSVDAPVVRALTDRRGITASHLPGRLTKAFEVLATMEINTLHMVISPWNDTLARRLSVCLQSMATFYAAVSRGAARSLAASREDEIPPVVYNEQSRPDPNLTLLAGLNKLKLGTVKGLVAKVAGLMAQADEKSALHNYASVYEALFAFKNIREKLVKPPLEINNVRWLIAENNQEVVSRDKARLGRAVYERFGRSPQEAAQVVRSIYGNDYASIRADALDARLGRVSDFLEAMEQDGSRDFVQNEVLANMRRRLDQVSDETVEHLSGVVTQDGGGETFRADLHSKLAEVVSFFRKRVGTRRKMRKMLSEAIQFDERDYDTISQDFGISRPKAEHLIGLLKSCFDQRGHFVRGAFEKNIPAFAEYDKKVFEFLWHYLKEIRSRDDRVAFLNSIQTLISHMNRKQQAVEVLVTDFVRSAGSVSFTDRNALILANVLLRKYNKELRNDIEMTPEEVLLVQEGLDREVAHHAATVIDGSQADVFQKMRTLHESLRDSLDGTERGTPLKPIRYLTTLQRESVIFCALAGGRTSHQVVLGVVQEYGNPESEVYSLKHSGAEMKSLLQLLQVSARGLKRFSDRADADVLREVTSGRNRFLTLGREPAHKDMVGRVMKWVDESAASIGG